MDELNYALKALDCIGFIADEDGIDNDNRVNFIGYLCMAVTTKIRNRQKIDEERRIA